MISPDDFGRLPARFVLTANAPVRAEAPTDEGDGAWHSIEDRLWLRLPDSRSVEVGDAGGEATARVAFSPERLSLTSESEEAWVWEPAKTNDLMSDVLAGILDDLDASVPQVPVWAVHRISEHPLLSWPLMRRHASRAEARKVQSDRLDALRDFSERLAEREQSGAAGLEDGGMSPTVRLRARLEVLPRPAEAEVEVAWFETPEMSGIGVTWRQAGDFDVVWGADHLTLADDGRRITVASGAADRRRSRRDLAARAYLVSMALCFESAFGSSDMPVCFRWISIGPKDKQDVALLVGPSDWGVEVPRLAIELESSSEDGSWSAPRGVLRQLSRQSPGK